MTAALPMGVRSATREPGSSTGASSSQMRWPAPLRKRTSSRTTLRSLSIWAGSRLRRKAKSDMHSMPLVKVSRSVFGSTRLKVVWS